MDDDARQIIDLTISYTWAIDSKNWAALDQVFVEDATAEMPHRLVGRRQIVERIERTLSSLAATQHIVTNHQVTVSGDEATCRCYLQAQHVRKIDGRRQNYLVGGGYNDSLVRTEDGWRIAHRQLVVTWTEGNPDVITNPSGGDAARRTD